MYINNELGGRNEKKMVLVSNWVVIYNPISK